MKRNPIAIAVVMITALVLAVLFIQPRNSFAENDMDRDFAAGEADLEKAELLRAQEALQSGDRYAADTGTQKLQSKKKPVGSYSTAEAFVAGSDWEFDGFVAGGQDSRIKSMFVINDLIYLNIGYAQGVGPGDRLSIYRRGGKIRDPQTGRFIGYEVRRAAVSEVTNKVDEETCAARIIRTYEGVEIGDLVKKGD